MHGCCVSALLLRTGTASQVVHSEYILKMTGFCVVVTRPAHRRGKKQCEIVSPLKCMDPAAQAHFNARARRNHSAYQRKASNVNMHEFRARSSIHRKREARTQPANMTHRLEEKRRKCRNKKHETSDHASADKRLSKRKKRILPSHHSKRRRIAKLQDATRKNAALCIEITSQTATR